MGERRLGAAIGVGAALSAWGWIPGAALAGAWPQAHGATEIIATVAAKRYNSIPEKEFDVYAEHGVHKDWTAIAGVRGWSRLDSGRTFVQVGLRRRLKSVLGTVVASEARLLQGRDWNECGGWGLESRVLAGRNAEMLGQHVFLDAEVAVRSFSDGCAEGRLELSAGAIRERGAGFLLQANAEKIFGAFARGVAAERMQAQTSVVYGLGHGLKVQAGVRLGFENTGNRERAVLVGVWRKF